MLLGASKCAHHFGDVCGQRGNENEQCAYVWQSICIVGGMRPERVGALNIEVSVANGERFPLEDARIREADVELHNNVKELRFSNVIVDLKYDYGVILDGLKTLEFDNCEIVAHSTWFVDARPLKKLVISNSVVELSAYDLFPPFKDSIYQKVTIFNSSFVSPPSRSEMDELYVVENITADSMRAASNEVIDHVFSEILNIDNLAASEDEVAEFKSDVFLSIILMMICAFFAGLLAALFVSWFVIVCGTN